LKHRIARGEKREQTKGVCIKIGGKERNWKKRGLREIEKSGVKIRGFVKRERGEREKRCEER
jgi:hypothetical protein